MSERWDVYSMAQAHVAKSMSKDPSTQVGACVASPDRRQSFNGWNGFPTGIKDDDRLERRDAKYPIIIHAELNAILNARTNLIGWTMYTTMHPCQRCASCIIQAGITRVVTYPEVGRWGDESMMAAYLFQEAGVQVDYL